MAKTPLPIRMEKYGAPKAWIVEVMQKNAKIGKLEKQIDEYGNIIDLLAREKEEWLLERARLEAELAGCRKLVKSYIDAYEKTFGALKLEKLDALQESEE